MVLGLLLPPVSSICGQGQMAMMGITQVRSPFLTGRKRLFCPQPGRFCVSPEKTQTAFSRLGSHIDEDVPGCNKSPLQRVKGNYFCREFSVPSSQTNTQRRYFGIRGRDAAGGRVLEFSLELIIVMWPIRGRTSIDHKATTACDRHLFWAIRAFSFQIVVCHLFPLLSTLAARTSLDFFLPSHRHLNAPLGRESLVCSAYLAPRGCRGFCR